MSTLTNTNSTTTTGRRALHLAARLTAPAKPSRSVKKPLGNAVITVVASAALLSSVTGFADQIRAVVDPSSGHPTSTVGFSPVEAEALRAESLMRHYECSTVGLDEGVFPEHALVRYAGDPVGRVSFVSFGEGWAVYEDETLGELLAVCAK